MGCHFGMRTMSQMRYLFVTASLALTMGVPAESSEFVASLDREPTLNGFDSCRGGSVQTDNCEGADYRSRWLARALGVDLYAVNEARCDRAPCPVWVVTKDARGKTRVVLRAVGTLHLAPEHDTFPVIETRRESTAGYEIHDRFRWAEERYVRVESRRIYRVDGIECDKEETCRDAAEDALRYGGVDRAVKIWQQVYGVNWI